MKVEDIRVGNYIIFPDGKPHKIGSTDFMILITTDFKDTEPIKLTEEILLKCGFEKGYTKGVFKLGDFTIDFYSKTFKFKREWIDINFKYLHQLQNLYFALTSKELKIRL